MKNRKGLETVISESAGKKWSFVSDEKSTEYFEDYTNDNIYCSNHVYEFARNATFDEDGHVDDCDRWLTICVSVDPSSNECWYNISIKDYAKDIAIEQYGIREEKLGHFLAKLNRYVDSN